MAGIEFGGFDHVEPFPGVFLEQPYRERLTQIAFLEQAGFYGYHIAEHHWSHDR